MLREEFEAALGDGLLYIAEIDRPDVWRRREADLAIVDRLGHALGMGCDLIVLNPDEGAHRARWERIEFGATDEVPGHQYRDQSLDHPRALETNDDRFEILPPLRSSEDDDDHGA